MAVTLVAPTTEPDSPSAAPEGVGRSPWYRSLVRGRPDDPAWVRPSLLALLLGTAVLFIYGLSASGYANSFYSAAVQAGSQSWKAFFYGSSDAANSITVDKTPASLWAMAISVRIFGLSSWSILVPQALMGVASVGLLYLTVRRWYGAGAGLLAGLTLALTPVAALMFRFNNPDAMLVLVMIAAVYVTVRAIEKASWRLMFVVGLLIGLGFLTKMLQVLLVVPALAIAYLVAAPTSFWRRVRDLFVAGSGLVIGAGWWIAIVSLVPAADRPYIGGSQDNSVLELALGYNGFGRLTGNETGSVGGGGGGAGGGWGATGIGRMFNSEMGGQVSWLLPAALILLVAGVVLAWNAKRTDQRRTGYIIWGGWLLVTGLVFSFMAGIFHAYYTVALAPAVAALVGMGTAALWSRRERWWARAVLAATMVVTSAWSFVLLGRSLDFLPWLRWVVVASGAVATAALVVTFVLPRKLVIAVAALAIVSALAGPAAYTGSTVATGHSGSIVSAGPSIGGQGGPGGGRPGGQGMPGGQGRPTQGTFPMPGTGTAQGRISRGAGGLLDAGSVGSEITALLQKSADSYTWVAATVGSQSSAGYQLATGDPVMAIGGFNGSDPSPTLAQFKAYVAAGKIHYFIGGGMGGGRAQDGGSSAASQIASWVAKSFTAQTVGGATVYDLTAAL
ncbi:4-amino-4-deoxy-L-arabinose transferase-like glycosyltransferase [Antricoccus suffuscus]|uniref:4-amino-4-deoxy-L-arabinose transferase-like glycosyltransferase n=1 Tax=Antricoccus suffuscus TaxID=1629062 RepID=A0A2T0ZYP8_9ACTN|nr:glycosyltransferase family 39 protein [Antricoccus suffuscus]PRZ41481.1 4-amino-4-deoxy-L-arabinose transferase-like glycosyltransferase [Antricoccus suffuscus]